MGGRRVATVTEIMPAVIGLPIVLDLPPEGKRLKRALLEPDGQ